VKYMGSKRHMLANGLGDLIAREARRADRFVDLFCGSGCVSWFAAENTNCRVVAVDLQEYAAVLAGAVIRRGAPLQPASLAARWVSQAAEIRETARRCRDATRLARSGLEAPEHVRRARTLCNRPSEVGPIWSAYGGHYFSPLQALTLDCLLASLPRSEPRRTVCLAASIWAASRCAAAPGHTAQPFQPTPGAAPFVEQAWSRDPVALCEEALHEICPRHARTAGRTMVSDGIQVAASLRDGDLVFVDPPYSNVQYSRFYHVLETIARGSCGAVDGRGRYPPRQERPQSDFSRKRDAREGVVELLGALAKSRSTVIFTFPDRPCSNGLSGDTVMEVAREWFRVRVNTIEGNFSTLGGNNGRGSRSARQPSRELLLLLRPKS